MRPKTDDVLVSRREANVEHEVTIVPEPSGDVYPNHESAVARAREMATQRHVDAWLTEDHTHFVPITRSRP